MLHCVYLLLSPQNCIILNPIGSTWKYVRFSIQHFEIQKAGPVHLDGVNNLLSSTRCIQTPQSSRAILTDLI